MFEWKRTFTSADIVQPESTRLWTSDVQSLIESIKKLEKEEKKNTNVWSPSAIRQIGDSNST